MSFAIRDLLERSQGDLALLIGNGINRFASSDDGNSWDALLGKLARSYLDPKHKKVPDRVALTEFYDLLDLATSSSSQRPRLQTEFCDLMAAWQPRDQHRNVVRWAKERRVPILTTNFDSTLSDVIRLKRSRIRRLRFTAYYPWDTYYGEHEISDPCTQFAIWHINGMRCYRQSIRLGLSHYMGSVEKARAWLYKRSNRLFGGGKSGHWPGSSTWLNVFFHKPLLIFGLALEENEVFLRWLLIERAKYFRKYPDRRKDAWYVYPRNEENHGKNYFLTATGVQPHAVADYNEIYGHNVWLIE